MSVYIYVCEVRERGCVCVCMYVCMSVWKNGGVGEEDVCEYESFMFVKRTIETGLDAPKEERVEQRQRKIKATLL